MFREFFTYSTGTYTNFTNLVNDTSISFNFAAFSFHLADYRKVKIFQ